MRDARESDIYRYFNRIPHRPSSLDVVLVQCVEDLYYFGLFGQIISSLRERRSVRVEQFVLKSLRVGESKSIIKFFAYRFASRPLGKKWVGLYNSFCDGIGYRSTSPLFSIGDIVDLYRAFICWRRLTTIDSLIALAIDDIPVGDLINDSFLRFKPAATVDLADFYLCLVIWQAYRDARRARKYFTFVRPKLYLTSYTTYVQHGIAVRVALRCGVKVFSFCNYQELAKKLSLTDWVHTKNPDNYADDFSKLEHQEQRLAEADIALTSRIAGINDNAIAYMKKPAYAELDEPIPDVQGALVIFLHDFFDSPHVYRNLVFPDFWEWVCFTIETLQKANIRFFIKPHPNQTDRSVSVLNQLKQCYPNVLIISSGVSNKQLVQAGLACAITVYGTVAHEMAYLGVPTIACAHHPHVSFDFCQTAKNKQDYARLLSQSTHIKFDKIAMRQQSLAFYYMHNLNLSAEEKSLWKTIFNFLGYCINPASKEQNPENFLNSIAKHPEFNVFVSKLSEIVAESR